jgi:hypothetical protein
MADEPRIGIFFRLPYAGPISRGMGRRLLLVSGVIGLGAFLFFYPLEVLTLTKEDRVLFFKRVNPGDTFQLAFLHSIALSEVKDFFLIDAEYRMVLTETRFQGQGTGLPYNLAQGEQLHREGDWFRITGMRRVLPSIQWRVQSQWCNRFRFGSDSESDLSARIGDALIRIQVQKMNLASYLGTYFKNENL